MAGTLGSGLSGHVLLWGNMGRVQEGRWAPMVWRRAAPRMPHGGLQTPLRYPPCTLPSSCPVASHPSPPTPCTRWGGIWAMSSSRW